MLLILPWAMPNYITALIWKGMFHRQFGAINQVLQHRSAAEPSPGSTRRSPRSCAALATNGWLGFPFMMVVSLGALQSIPADLYEAARVDGATRWQQFRPITLPLLQARAGAGGHPVGGVDLQHVQHHLPGLGRRARAAPPTSCHAGVQLAFERYRYGYAAAYSTVIFVILLALRHLCRTA